MHSVKLQALSRVKVNLYLHIIGKRADGYHNLDSLVAFPEIGDEILKEEKGIIQDLITAAHNNAKSQLKSKTSEELSKATGGFGIPGFKWPL